MMNDPIAGAGEAATARRVCAQRLTVERVDHVCAEHVWVDAVAKAMPPSQPGQFLQILCADEDAPPPATLDWPEGEFPRVNAREFSESGAYLRRPFSIADREDRPESVRISVISRAIGPGTRWLDQLSVGDVLNISGPLGVGFRLPKSPAPVLLVGGGVGIPPLLYAARELATRGFRDVTCVFGVMRADLFPVPMVARPASDGRASMCLHLPGAAPFPAVVTTDDGSLGLRGYAVAGLRAAVEQGKSGERPLVLACGPERMLDSIATATRALGLPCQLCIERHMGCGLGTCLSCVVKVNAPQSSTGWRWALSCLEGPVFDRDSLWEESPTPPAAPPSAAMR